jgi:simple sugar transport system substrate-binding protein
MRAWFLGLAAPVVLTALVSGGGARAAEITSLAVMTPEEANDFGWNQQGASAAESVAKKYGLKFTLAQGLGYGDVRATLRELADEKTGLIIAHASGYNTAAPEIAVETHTRVAVTDNPKAVVAGLVTDYTQSGAEGAFLAGILAARTTRTGTVGIVVSGEPPAWNSQSFGFAQGAKAARPDIRIRYAVIGPAAYSDAAGAKRVTEAAIAAGADVIFGQGNGASFGMLQAVETAKPADGGKIWFIDVIGDKSSIDHGNLLSSVVWDFAPAFDQMVQDIKGDTFGTHNYRLNLASGSIRLLKTPHIPDATWNELMAAQADIISGKMKVEETFDAARVHSAMSSVEAGK